MGCYGRRAIREISVHSTGSERRVGTMAGSTGRRRNIGGSGVAHDLRPQLGARPLLPPARSCRGRAARIGFVRIGRGRLSGIYDSHRRILSAIVRSRRRFLQSSLVLTNDYIGLKCLKPVDWLPALWYTSAIVTKAVQVSGGRWRKQIRLLRK